MRVNFSKPLFFMSDARSQFHACWQETKPFCIWPNNELFTTIATDMETNLRDKLKETLEQMILKWKSITEEIWVRKLKVNRRGKPEQESKPCALISSVTFAEFTYNSKDPWVDVFSPSMHTRTTYNMHDSSLMKRLKRRIRKPVNNGSHKSNSDRNIREN